MEWIEVLLEFDLQAFVSVIIIDLVMSRDNAIIIGLAAAGLAPQLKRRAIFYGIVGATVLRILFASVTIQLLNIIGLLLAGGILLQTRDAGRVAREDLEVVTKRAPDERELADLAFAFRVAKHVKSNAIVYVRDGATVGVGAGQMSRIDSARIAALKAREAVEAAERAGRDPGALGTQGSVVASDAFFPFADGLLIAIEAGATAVIQPGGSVRDQEVIAAADDAGIAMVFTGMRHFRH